MDNFINKGRIVANFPKVFPWLIWTISVKFLLKSLFDPLFTILNIKTATSESVQITTKVKIWQKNMHSENCCFERAVHPLNFSCRTGRNANWFQTGWPTWLDWSRLQDGTRTGGINNKYWISHNTTKDWEDKTAKLVVIVWQSYAASKTISFVKKVPPYK